jgi:multidrug resistance efflux pump
VPAPYPRARDDLQVLRRVLQGEVTYVIGDVVSGSHKELDEMQYTVLGMLDGRHTVEELTAQLVKEHELELTPDELGQFIDTLQEQSLLDPSTDLRIDSKDQRGIVKKLRAHLEHDGVVFARRDAAPAAQHKGPERRARHEEARLFDAAVWHLEQDSVRMCAAALRELLDLNPKNHRARYLHTRILEAHLAERPPGTWFFRRVPLWNPNQFLRRASEAIGDLVMSRAAAVAWVSTLVLAAAFVASRSALVVQNTQRVVDETLFFDPRVWVGALSIRFVSILLHEVAHGFVCRHYGGYVREIGLLFVGPSAGAYCDVSSTYMVEPRARRIAVYAAGTFTDLLWFAVLLVGMALDGLPPIFYAVCFVSSMTVIITVVSNLVPLLRNDAYLALSDALSYPNLLEDGFEIQMWLLVKLFVRWDAPLDDALRARFTLLFVYGILARALIVTLMVWSLVAATGMLVSHFAGYGVIAAGVMSGLLARSFWVRMREPTMRLLRSSFATRQGRIALSLTAALTTLALIVPLPHRVSVDARLEQPSAPVRTRVAGVVRRLVVSDGAAVKRGELLVALDTSELDLQRLAAEERMRTNEAMLAAAKRGVRPEAAAVAKQAERAAAIARNAAASALRRQQELAQRGLSRQDEGDALRALSRRLETNATEAAAAARALLGAKHEDTIAILQDSLEADRTVLAELAAVRDAMELRAPADGNVVFVELPRAGGADGLRVQAGTELLRVVATAGDAIAHLELPFTIPPDALPAGARAELIVRSAAQQTLTLQVSEVSKQVRRRGEGEGSALVLDVRARVTDASARTLPDGASGIARVHLEDTPLLLRISRTLTRAFEFDLQRALGQAESS